MDAIFEVSPEVRDTVDRVRQFVDEELIPREPELLGKEFSDSLGTLNVLRQRVRELGLWAPAMPRELGGMGLDLVEFAHISETLGRSPFGHYVFNVQAPDIGNMEILAHFGTEPQKKKWLEPLVAGEIRSCFAMTEPELPGSNPTWMATQAIRDGDEYVINGHKWFTSSFEGAAFAIVMAVTDPDAQRHRRASQIIVPTDTKGFEHVRNISVMGEAGSDYASHAEVRFHDVRVPVSNLLGEENAGFAIAQERLGPGRIHHCMRWLGICERAFDLMVSRALDRPLTPDKVLADQQIIQAWIAESRAEIHAARLTVLHAAWSIEEKGAKAARDAISLIKFTVAGVLQRVLDRAIQVHGALGVTDDLPLAYWYRHERAARIYDGADEVHKTVVARRILKRARAMRSDD